MEPGNMRPRFLLLAFGAAMYFSGDLAALQGSWRVVDARARMSNEPAMNIDGLVDRGTVEFNGNVLTMRQLPHVDLASFSFTLDTLALPRRIRLVDQRDSAKWTGIYRVSR